MRQREYLSPPDVLGAEPNARPYRVGNLDAGTSREGTPPMIRSTRRLSSVAARAALGLVLAGALAASTPVVAQQYPNHRPLSGNYPGSYTSSAAAPSSRPSAGFDWVTAGIGAAGMLGLVLLLTALRTARRSRALDVPLVLEVRDNRPA
jgi:hypothetical protein